MFSFSSPLQQQHAHLTWQYVPQTPSPLRTSRNANQMPPPPSTQNDATKSSPLQPSSSPLSNVLSSVGDENAVYHPSHHGGSEVSKFRFEQRARSTSPRVELAVRTNERREQRRRLFLERLRGKKDEERFEGRGEQVLRMDFVRERREWEDRLRREFQEEVGLGEDDEMEGLEGHDGQNGGEGGEVGGLSPTEEREIEELVGLLQEQETSMSRHGDLSDDEEYDQLFMEVIRASQEMEVEHVLASSSVRQTEAAGDRTSGDTEMDMS